MTGPERPDYDGAYPRRTVSETELWRGAIVSAGPKAPTTQLIAAVRVALRAFGAANLSPEFGFPLDDAERLWPVRLMRYSPESVIEASNQWTRSDATGFPKLEEFAKLVEETEIRHDRMGRPKRVAGQKCPECDDAYNGFVVLDAEFVEGPDGARYMLGVAELRPCSECRPEMFDLYDRGHYKLRFGEAGCVCGSRFCKSSERISARRRAS